jgi:hypothetical protein
MRHYYLLPLLTHSFFAPFRYVELRGGAVTKHWWGEEKASNARKGKNDIACPAGWVWDGGWKVDGAGDVDSHGWESCRSLHGGAVGGWSGETQK